MKIFAKEISTDYQAETPRGVRGFLKSIQNRISSSPSSYLFYAFIVPVVLTYLIYLSMGIHPFGNGSVLVLDLNGQYVYFFEALRNAIYGEGSFLYTFFRALGGEFMGMYAYYLASPLSYIVALFPADRILEALLTIILLKAGLCGLTFGFYLHKNSAHPNKYMVVAFSTMYALCSFAVVHQNNIMWMDALFWLPIIAYSIEQIVKNRRYKLFVISLSLTLMSNYYIGYMVCIFCVVYFLYYYLAHHEEIRNPHGEKLHWLKSAVRFGAFALLAAAIAAVIILCAYYSLTFGKNDFSDPNWSLRANFDFLDFFTKFLPGAYDTVRPEGLPFVYCGLLVLITVPVYFMSKAISSREKIASIAIIAFFVICFIASPLDLIWHGFQKPNWLNHRYSFMLCFILLVLAYKGFANLRKCNEKFILGICAFIILFVAVSQKMTFETYVETEEKLNTFSTVWLTLIATVVLLVLLCLLIRTKDYRKRSGITAILASVICVEVFLNALGMVIQFDGDVTYSGYSGYNDFIGDLRPVVEQIKEDDPSFYRMEKLVHRKYNDNMALGIRGLSNSTSTLNSSTIEFLQNLGYTSRSHLSKYQGGNPVNDSLLGIKYVIDQADSDKLTHYFENVSEGEKYDVYYNQYSLSLAYGVSKDVMDFNFDSYKTRFEALNGLVGALCEDETTSELFKAVNDYDEVYNGCTKNSNYQQTVYTATTTDATATITYSFIASEAAEYYFQTPSNSPKECLISVNGTNLGKYLGSDTRNIFPIGWFEKGEKVSIKITLKEDPLNIINGCDYIWYLDRDVFEDCFSELRANPQLVIDDSYEEDRLTGTINTTDSQTMIMTTIPYDKGWNIYVDGEQVETYQTLDALVAFDICESGAHNIEMRYMPGVYSVGISISIIGIVIFAAICLADFTLKKTLFKNRLKKDINTPWQLEDFDEDHIEYINLPDEEVPQKSMLSYLSRFKRKNKAIKKSDGDNSSENNPRKKKNEENKENGDI